MLYEYRHVGRRCRSCPQTFELIRKVTQRDDDAACPKCGSRETARLKFQSFTVAGGDTELTGAGPMAAPGNGPYADHIPANMPDDLDSDTVGN